MIGEILKWTAIGVATWWAGDRISRAKTGKPLHQLVFHWWCETRDAVNTWVSAHPNIRVRKWVGRIIEVLDDAAVAAMKLVTLSVNGIGVDGTRHEVHETIVRADELAKLFPQFRNRRDSDLGDLGLVT